jgi:Tfp pilus assembly protein PilF
MKHIPQKNLRQVSFLSILIAFLFFTGCQTISKISNLSSKKQPLTAEQYYSEGTRFLNRDNNPQKAYDAFSKAISLKPDYMKAYLERGVAAYGIMKDQEAAKDFDKWIELSKKSSDPKAGWTDKYTIFIMAETYYTTKQIEKAKKYYKKYLDVANAAKNPTMKDFKMMGIASSRLDSMK